MRDWKYVDQSKLIEEARAADIPAARLLELAAQGPRVEAEVAKNPRAPLDLLVRLAENGKVMAWLGLVENPALPLPCYAILVKRAEAPIDRAIATSKSAPAVVMEKLYQRGAATTLRAMAKNPKTPAILERLSSHRVSGVYRAALKNPENPLYMEGKPWQRFSTNMDTYYIRLGMPLPKALLERYARSTNYREQSIAAFCPDLTNEMMRKLSQSTFVVVRAGIARHPKITQELARELLKDPSPAVTNAVKYNPNVINTSNKKR